MFSFHVGVAAVRVIDGAMVLLAGEAVFEGGIGQRVKAEFWALSASAPIRWGSAERDSSIVPSTSFRHGVPSGRSESAVGVGGVLAEARPNPGVFSSGGGSLQIFGRPPAPAHPSAFGHRTVCALEGPELTNPSVSRAPPKSKVPYRVVHIQSAPSVLLKSHAVACVPFPSTRSLSCPTPSKS